MHPLRQRWSRRALWTTLILMPALAALTACQPTM
jgi:hypothetical protein